MRARVVRNAFVIGVAAVAALLCLRRVAAQSGSQASGSAVLWQFAVSGDSRNCGDVVMPAIAADALKHDPQFYWHLGDFRAIYTFDEDILHQIIYAKQPPSIYAYEGFAWRDFIENQLAPFGTLPVFLSIGNHETIAPKNREQYIPQFADWLDTPVIREQRLRDNPRDHLVRTYYHWRAGNVDFVTMDNGSLDQFDDAQEAWAVRTIEHDTADAGIAAIVVGMHRALPDSITADHSMNESAQGIESGRHIYQLLVKAQLAHKHVYLLASHSHFYMANAFNTDYVSSHGGVLPGWIVGTAGAVRYPLPPNAKDAGAAQTNVYGYLLGGVHADGSIDFVFHKLEEKDVPADAARKFEPGFVRWCFAENSAAGEMH